MVIAVLMKWLSAVWLLFFSGLYCPVAACFLLVFSFKKSHLLRSERQHAIHLINEFLYQHKFCLLLAAGKVLLNKLGRSAAILAKSWKSPRRPDCCLNEWGHDQTHALILQQDRKDIYTWLEIRYRLKLHNVFWGSAPLQMCKVTAPP